MKKILILFSFFLLANVGCTVSDPEMMELLVEINNQNKELLAEVKSLQSKSDSLINEIKSSSAKQEELVKKVNLLQGEIGKVLLDISKLAEDIKKQGVDIELIKSQLADLQKKYDQIIIQLEQLQQLSKILAEIENLKGQLKDLDAKYLVVINSLGQNQQALDALKSQVTLLQNQLAQNLTKISELTTLLGQQGVDIGKILAEIAELKKSTEEIKKSLEELLSGGSTVPTNGLVAWYPFNGNANDESGNGFNGTVNGATLTTNRLETANSAYAFNGSNGHIIANGNQRFVSPQMTTSAWVLFNQLSSNGLQYLVLGNATNAAWAYSYRSQNNSSNLLKNQGCGLIVNHDWAFTFSPNKWYHVVYVISNTAISSYVNGVFISSQPSAPFNTNCSSYILNIGLDVFGQKEYLNGKMDDIAIWDRALTADEISKIYKGEKF
jgi:iron-sulfur cluster repair protein YtfE (RIC family)